MTLADLQTRFLQGLMSDEAALPDEWRARERAGYHIYRSAYRTRLFDALRESYPRTARLVGDDAFQAAAAHHLIGHPPRSWTLDDAGHGFDRTLEDLFPHDRDVAELGWIEWAMQTAFTSKDVKPLDAPGLIAATAAFGDREWQNLRFEFVPGLAVRQVDHDCRALWSMLDEDNARSLTAARALPCLPQAKGCVVWREGLRSTFALTHAAEAQALTLMAAGADYGAACDLLTGMLGEKRALTLSSEMLARWLTQGWISAAVPPAQAAAGPAASSRQQHLAGRSQQDTRVKPGR